MPAKLDPVAREAARLAKYKRYREKHRMDPEYLQAKRERDAKRHARISGTEEYRAKQRETAKRMRAAYPEKARTRMITRNAIRRGDLVRQPCEVCGSERVDAHHDDYSKPLEVRWLCRKHHSEHHARATQPLPQTSEES